MSAPGPSEWLTRNARHLADDVCLLDPTHQATVTFREFDRLVNRVSNALLAAGVERGDRVLVVSVDRYEYLAVWFACLRTRTVCVPVNVRLKPSEIDDVIRDVTPAVVFVDGNLTAKLESCAALAEIPHRVSYDEQPGWLNFTAFQIGVDGTHPGLELDPEDILGLAFTSGTSGKGKQVLQSARMLTSLVTTRLISDPPRRGELWYSGSPMFHISGVAALMAGVSFGYGSLLLPSFHAETVLEWLQSGRLNVCFMVPTMISAVLALPGIQRGRFPGLRKVMYGAAPMTPTLLQQAHEIFGCDFTQYFGAGTESGLQCSLNEDDHRRALNGEAHLLGSVGRPVFGVELRLLGVNMSDVRPGEVGEVAVRSGMLMTGYRGAQVDSFHEGWFHAGDLARQDEEGYLYLAGRRSDMIIRGGENIFPIEIENVIAAMSNVRQVAVVGGPDPHWGQVLHAFVTGSALDEADIRNFCRERLAGHKVPSVFHFVDDLPRNAAGKIKKRDLEASLAGDS
jgi:acyl-CoA synthetase (AMP-forming)/AMP-acid ligase II